MRDSKGRFVKGVSASPDTQFKPGQHWRKPQLFRDRDWLIENYIEQQRSTGEIAKDFGVTDAAVIFWLRKHNIKRRTVAEARAIKRWGMIGSDNPMWNKRGELNPRWMGGVTPERQAFYTSEEWRNSCSMVWERDKATCQRCGLRKTDLPDMPFHIHHIVAFANGTLRSDPDNLVLLCEACHHYVHSRKNKNNEYISEI
jgi:hypothetical protein